MLSLTLLCSTRPRWMLLILILMLRASSWDRAIDAITNNLPMGGFLDQSRSYMNSYNWRNQLNFNREFFDGRDYMLDMGTKVAPYTLGLVNSFKIYDFDVSFIVTGKFGHVFNGFTFNYPSMSGGNMHFPLLRYAEVLLTYAEAKIMLNQVDDLTKKCINDIRRRAFQLQMAIPREQLEG